MGRVCLPSVDLIPVPCGFESVSFGLWHRDHAEWQVLERSVLLYCSAMGDRVLADYHRPMRGKPHVSKPPTSRTASALCGPGHLLVA